MVSTHLAFEAEEALNNSQHSLVTEQEYALNSSQNILEHLNPEQREAVQTSDGPLLIVAGPGSGKTRVITHRIAYLMSERRVQPYRIMAVTFTRQAAREMKNRLGNLGLPRAQKVYARNFHSFGFNVLKDHGLRIGIDREFEICEGKNQDRAIDEAIKRAGLNPLQFPRKPVQAAISKAKSHILDAHSFSKTTATDFDEQVSRVYQCYAELLNSNNAVDFDDLLLKTVQLFQTDAEVLELYQQRFQYVMVDEFQDTNVVQYHLAKQMAGGHRNICVVGDPDQSIYSWRDADIRHILSSFRKDYSDAKIVNLVENYRSTGTILSAAQRVIAANRMPLRKPLRASRSKGSPIISVEAETPDAEADHIMDQVVRLRKDEGIPVADCAVLYRTNAQSRRLEEMCMRRGMHYRLLRGVPFYDRVEIKSLVCYLRLLVNPHDTESRRSLQATSALGGFQRVIDDLTRLIQQVGVVELLDTLLERTNYYQKLKGMVEDANEGWENVMEFRTLAQKFQAENPPEGLFSLMRRLGSVANADNHGGESEGLALGTLHSAKGAEFPIVFIIGMEEGLLPHKLAIDDEKQMEEERRLCYVGITRAKDRLFLTRSLRRGNDLAIPSRFLQDIPPQLIQLPEKPQTEPITPKEPLQDPSAPTLQFKQGDKVFHKMFGQGVVIKTAFVNGDVHATVAFDEKRGVKKLLVGMAPLQKL